MKAFLAIRQDHAQLFTRLFSRCHPLQRAPSLYSCILASQSYHLNTRIWRLEALKSPRMAEATSTIYYVNDGSLHEAVSWSLNLRICSPCIWKGMKVLDPQTVTKLEHCRAKYLRGKDSSSPYRYSDKGINSSQLSMQWAIHTGQVDLEYPAMMNIPA